MDKRIYPKVFRPSKLPSNAIGEVYIDGDLFLIGPNAYIVYGGELVDITPDIRNYRSKFEMEIDNIIEQ